MKLQDLEGYTPITKQSINNVKCKSIFSGENSQRYNKYIQYLARKVLELSAKRTDGYQFDEVGIVADIKNESIKMILYGYWNEKTQVSEINTYRNYKYEDIMTMSKPQSLVFVHNHPNNSIISISDILTFLWNDPEQCSVIVGNNGDIHYVIKTEKRRYSQLSVDINIKLRSKEITYNELYKVILENPSKFGLYIE